jgi:ribosomal protein S18 acetylase RimI-like enzyme
VSDAPSLPIRIEPAGVEHLAEIAALARIIWRAHYPGIISSTQIEYMLERMYNVEAMARELGNGVVYERLLVSGKLRGFSSFGPAPDATELKLHKLYIHPNAQRQGLGGMLLQRVEEAARERGLQHVVLAVNKQNAKAIAAYRKHGFAIRESVMADIGGGFVMDDYVMAKRVSPATR